MIREVALAELASASLHPLVVRGAARDWPRLTIETLAELLGDRPVEVQSRHGQGASDFAYRTVPFRSFALSVRDEAARDYCAFSPILPREIASTLGPLPLEVESPRLFVAPKGALTPLHWDVADGVLVQLEGSKRVAFARPGARRVVRSPSLWPPRRLVDGGEALETDALVLGPGDMVYLPGGLRHHVRTLDPGVSLTFPRRRRFQLFRSAARAFLGA